MDTIETAQERCTTTLTRQSAFYLAQSPCVRENESLHRKRHGTAREGVIDKLAQ
jgi:hypothetical protein